MQLTDALRQQLITELDRERHGFGLAAEYTGEASERTPTCGDDVTVRVSVAGDVIDSLTWQGHGCTVSMASASALARLAPGLTLAEFDRLAERFLAAVKDGGAGAEEFGPAEPFVGIGRFPLRAGCAALSWRATLAAVAKV